MNRELLQILLSIHSIGMYEPTHEKIAVLKLILAYSYEQTLEAVFNE